MDFMKCVLGFALIMWLPAPMVYGVVENSKSQEQVDVSIYPSAEIRVYMEVQSQRIQYLLQGATANETIRVFQDLEQQGLTTKDSTYSVK